MKKRELFLNRIQIDDTYSMQVDELEENLIIYENDVEIEQFSLRRRIYTLFKVLQEYTNSIDYIEDKEKKHNLYGKEIQINNDVYMQLNDEYGVLAIEFYQKIPDGEDELLYLTKLDYMTQKLFTMMLIPNKVIEDPKYQILNPKEFKDLIEILSLIKV